MKDPGEEARDAGLERVEAGCAAWIAAAREFAILTAQRVGVVTSDDVEAGCAPPPVPNAVGAVFRSPMFRSIGMRKTERKVGHARRILEWALSDQGVIEARRLAGVDRKSVV